MKDKWVAYYAAGGEYEELPTFESAKAWLEKWYEEDRAETPWTARKTAPIKTHGRTQAALTRSGMLR